MLEWTALTSFSAAKIKIVAAAVVQRMHTGRALIFKPGGNFKIGNDERLSAFGNFQRITDVVVVTMRNENGIRRHRLDANVFCQRIAGNERVEQEVLAADDG